MSTQISFHKRTKPSQSFLASTGHITPELNQTTGKIKALFPNRFPLNKMYHLTSVIRPNATHIASEPTYYKTNNFEYAYMMKWLKKYHFKKCPKLTVQLSNSSLQSNNEAVQTFGRQSIQRPSSMFSQVKRFSENLTVMITLPVTRSLTSHLSFSKTNLSSLKATYASALPDKRWDTTEKLNSLALTVKKLVHLDKLALNFTSRADECAPEGLQFLKSKRILKLKELSLNFSWKMTWAALYKSVFRHLEKQGQIRLRLDYNKTYTSTKIYIKFRKTAEGTEIDCNLEAWFDSGFSVHDIYASIFSLKALSINFSGDDVYINKDGQRIALHQCADKTQLEHLDLTFSHQFFITLDGLQSLQWFIADHLPFLQTLNLNFTRCLVLNAEFIQTIADCVISRIKTLKRLGLSFIHCQKLTDEGIEILSSCFTHPLQTFKSVDLTFVHCDKITDAGVGLLGLSLCNPLDTLDTLKLSFRNCGRITSYGINELEFSLKCSLSEIKSLNIDFKPGSKIISEDAFWEPEQGKLFEGEVIEFDYPDFDENKSYMHDYDLENYSNFDYGSDNDEISEPEYYRDQPDYGEELLELEEYVDYYDFYNFDRNAVANPGQR